MQASILPKFDGFSETLAAKKPQVIYCKHVLDLETPVSAMLKLQRESSHYFLLESVEGGETRGRYSVIGLYPDMAWRCVGNKPERSNTPPFADDSFEPEWDASLDSLRNLLDAHKMDLPENLPPMAAGLVGYMGYDMVKLMEKLPNANPDPIDIPDAFFIRPRLFLIFDAVDGVVYIIVPIWETSGDARVLYDAAIQRIKHVATLLQGPVDQRNYYKTTPENELTFTSNTPRKTYDANIEKAKEYIKAGDVFQVVLSQRFQTPFDLPPMALYRALRHLNPSPFLFHLQFGDLALVGSSPEILVRLRDDVVTIRPIAGTRKRGKTPAEDRALEAELLADPKECAEHLMLLDLGRNDVGRVSKPGKVRVTQHMQVERYSHVMHIVSNVEGSLAEGHDTLDVLSAGFPAGTVSGAPKIRAMEIIDELEVEKRSFYAGCVGYFSANGSMDTCITLRTALIKDGMLYVQAGGGIVADSQADAEYEESYNKASAVMRAATQAIKFA
jgi:anthranilate synthase component 1